MSVDVTVTSITNNVYFTKLSIEQATYLIAE